MSRPPPFLLLLGLAVTSVVRAANGTLQVAVADGKGAPVEDAVVSLVPLDAAAPAPVLTAPAPVQVVQKNQTFLPFVTAVAVGTSVVFPNEDTVQHHIYSLSKAKRFEKPLYAPGSRESVLFDQPGLVTLGCNIHDWMLAYLVVVPTPYFAKSDAAGALAIPAPAGRYKLELWHPRLAAPLNEEVALAEGATLRREFKLTLKPDRRIRRGPEGKGSGY